LEPIRTDLLTRYALGVVEDWPLLVITIALLWIWLWLVRARVVAPRWVQWPFAVAAAGAGVASAWSMRWICDDAFIAFRYARNWAEGNGLVFNLGERVEGYTNFLWTALLAGFHRIGLDLAQLSLVCSLTSLALTVVLIALLVRRYTRDAPSSVPIAALLFAANYGAASFGTSGLETMFCTMLAALALERASRIERSKSAAALAMKSARARRTSYEPVSTFPTCPSTRSPSCDGRAPSFPTWSCTSPDTARTWSKRFEHIPTGS